MRYLVVLEPSSAIGRSYLAGKDADLIHLGEYPVIDCSRVEVNGPYLFCLRGSDHETAPASRANPSARCSELLIPHHAVAFVFQHARQHEQPPGFATQRT